MGGIENGSDEFERWAPWGPGTSIHPVSVFVGSGALALRMTPARLRSWREGSVRAAGDPLCALWLGEDENTAVLAASEREVDPTETLRSRPLKSVVCRGSRRSLLVEMSDEVRLDRALGQVGLPRRLVDRYLNEKVEFEVETLPVGFGGLGQDWWREFDGQPVAIRMDRIRLGGWLVLELAALGHSGEGEAFDLARLAIALRRSTLERDPASGQRVALEILRREPEPATVSVSIQGAEVVRGCWEATGATVRARRARWLLQHVDGLSIAGEPVRVTVEPQIRPGRRPPRRESRGVRQRRLFSLWDRGIRVDDDGLVGLTPERMALAIASRAQGVVIDGTCGVGGLAIALASTPAVDRVIAVDISASRLAMAQHNARIYGVADRIEFVCGDVSELLASHLGERSANTLVLDPPWGGRSYDRERVTLTDLPMPVELALQRFSGEVLLKLPRSFDPSTLPGTSAGWKLQLLLDDREIPKMLLAIRVSRES